MSALVNDVLDQAEQAVGRIRQPAWGSFQLRDKGWERVSLSMVKALDRAKGHGMTRPLAGLQEVAFERSLQPGASTNEALQTVALWLTDSRLLMEQYIQTKDADLRRLLEVRGLLKSKAGAGDE